MDKPKILIVDDKLANIISLETLLSEKNIDFIRAQSGQEALRTTLDNDFALILMDIQMPEMDGEEATKIIREKWPVKEQPWIVAMTAHALGGDREHYMTGGMDDYISKPLNVKELMRILERSPRKAIL